MSEGQDQGMNALSPVRSYDPGNDHLEPVISKGETKYEGKGKGRCPAESFSHLPTTVPGPTRKSPGPSAPSTAPSTRPTSEIPDASEPSTAPPTRPVSQVQDDKAPSTGQAESSAMATQGDPGSSTDQTESAAMAIQGDPGSSTGQTESAATANEGDPGPNTDQAESASATGQGDSAAISAQDGTPNHTGQSGSGPTEFHDEVPTKSISARYECGCRDVYDDTGKKRQQACQRHKLDPNRSILPLPPKRPLSESTNMSAEQRILSLRAPQATRNEESPPRQPPVITPFLGRNFVQASETGPTFLDPFNSEPAIEPTGPPNSLTTIPTAKDEPLKKKSTGQVSIAKESGPKAAGPKATDPVTPQTPSNPPQVDEGAQANQPQRDPVAPQTPSNPPQVDEGAQVNQPQRDLVAPQTPSNPPQVDEGASGSQATQPQKLDAVEGQALGSDISKEEQPTEEKATTKQRRVELGGTDEIPEIRRDGDDSGLSTPTPIARLNSPHHRRKFTPRSILKKTAGTAAEARQAEEGGASDTDSRDPGRGTKLFRGTLAMYRAAANSRNIEADILSRLNAETPSGARTPRFNMELHAISGGDSSDGDSSDMAAKCCVPGCNLL